MEVFPILKGAHLKLISPTLMITLPYTVIAYLAAIFLPLLYCLAPVLKAHYPGMTYQEPSTVSVPEATERERNPVPFLHRLGVLCEKDKEAIILM